MSDQAGGALGLPMFHAVTGNLPVIPTSLALHRPDKAAEAEFAAVDAEAAGRALEAAAAELGLAEAKRRAAQLPPPLQPGWVALRDPATRRAFYWNQFFRSRRDERPDPEDDGAMGAGRGEVDASKTARRNARIQGLADAKTWVERYDLENSCLFYWNRKTGKTQWERPAGFFEDGLRYKSRWEEVQERGGDIHYKDRATGKIFAEMPNDYDGTPTALSWEKDPGGGSFWVNWRTQEHSKDMPTILAVANLSLPKGPPPPAPADGLCECPPPIAPCAPTLP